MSLYPVRKVATYLLGIPLFIFHVHAQENALTLNEVLYETIQNNLSLKVNAVDQYLKEQDIQIAESAFDSTLFGGVSTSESELGSISTSESSSSYLGFQKRFSTGTSVTLQTSYDGNSGRRFDPLLNQFVGGSDNHNARLSVSVRQSLLRGFGKSANLANVWKAESQLEVAKIEYKNWLLDIVNLTEKSYWILAGQQANLELSKTSVEVAESLLYETEERADVGLATKLDVLQAKANLASKNESFLVAEGEVADAFDQLYTYMGRLTPDFDDEAIEVSSLREMDSDIPELATVWGGALNTDLDTKIQQANIASLDFDRTIAKDRLRTDLDLVLQGATNGLSGESYSDAYSGAFEKQGHNVGVSLELSVPIGKRSAKARVNKIDAIAKRELLKLEQIEQSLFRNVRAQWRTLNVSVEKLKASRTTLELEEQAFEQAQVKYSNGLAVFRDVQEAQDSLNRARMSELRAWITALQAEANLSRLDGTQLERLQIIVNFEE